MHLNKAIEILELNIKEAGKKMPPDTLDALKLGVEALERFKSARDYPGRLKTFTLPGEISIEDPGLSTDDLNRVKSSPLGQEPKG